MPEVLERTVELERFLGQAGADLQQLRDEAESAFGRPDLVVATGSVLQGYGNGDSDVDLHVVVDREHVTSFPVMTFSLGARVDMTFHAAADLRALVDSSLDDWPRTGLVDRETWLRHRSAVDKAMLLAVGATIDGSEDWCTWVDGFRTATFIDRLVAWWQIEALRRLTAARWVVGVRPMLGVQRYVETMLAALEVRACRAGECYTRPKWLPERFKRLDDDRGIELFRSTMRAPTAERGVAEFVSWCEEQLVGLQVLPVLDGLAAHLSFATGVHHRRLIDRWLIDRWGMRCSEVADGPVSDAGLRWIGSLHAPDPIALELFLDDMAWLGIGRTEDA
jgi:hypothetical protein